MQVDTEQDWQSWSRESVRLMQERNRAFVERFGLAGRAFQWNLDVAQIAFPSAERAVVADICVVGSVSEREGTFLWAWGNNAIPPRARVRIGEVRAFGETHDLPLLTTVEWQGGKAEGLEMLAVAGRVLNAEGVFVAPDGDRTFFFALHCFRMLPLQQIEWLSDPAGNGR
jgi:hypothetical protein